MLRISVIIPAKNRAHTLTACLDLLLSPKPIRRQKSLSSMMVPRTIQENLSKALISELYGILGCLSVKGHRLHAIMESRLPLTNGLPFRIQMISG